MKKIVFIVISVSIVISSFAQSKQDYVWLFGQDMNTSAFNGYLFDFNNPPMQVREHDNNIGIGSANASICDPEGNLLFYMNGCAVMNRNYQMMPNGDSLSYDEIWEVFNFGCNRGFPFFQDNIILKSPSSENEYYIIHKPSLYNGNGNIDSLPIWYSIVDMTSDESLGDVVQKNVVLDNSKNFLSSYLTAINHENERDWWMIQAPTDDSVFHTFLIANNGIFLDTIQPSNYLFTRSKTSASGTAKFSPDGTKYTLYNETDGLLIYDFDRETGILDFKKRIITYDTSGIGIFCSLEWSPNSRFIYTATRTHLHQVDLWEEDIQENGIRLIDTYNGTQDPFSTTFFLMAQAPDCKIYMCPTSGTRSYHVIHRPDELGTACNFVQNGLKLPQTSNFGGMPNFPRFRVDEEDKCDPTLTSVFGDGVYYRRDLRVYPSPSDGRYTVELPEDFSNGVLTIINPEGNIIKQQKILIHMNAVNIDISSVPAGYYQIELYPDEHKGRLFWGSQVIKH